MSELDKASHWEKVYASKKFEEVSWYQENPSFFLALIQSLNLDKKAAIIDVGCGESKLIQNLHQLGYFNLSGLDISTTVISKNQDNFAHLLPEVQWIATNITLFNPGQKYRLWHDRAVFHFLTESIEIKNYVQLCANSIESGGYLILSTFSKNGPLKCSGLEIVQYNHEDIQELFAANFDIISQSYHDHETPFATIQNFQTSVLKRK